MVCAHLVGSPREDDQRTDARRAPADVSQQIERGRIGPVHVLEDDQCGSLAAGQAGDERREQLVPRGLGRDERRKVAPQVVGHVEERTERPWRGERLAGAPEKRHDAGLPRHEGRDQRRLADAGFTRDGGELAEGLRRRQRARQLPKRVLALEQHHGHVIIDRSAASIGESRAQNRGPFPDAPFPASF